MKNLIYLSCLLFLFACQDDPITGPTDPMEEEEEMEVLLADEILGTWIMESATASADGESLTEQADEWGCLTDSEFSEIDCIAFEFLTSGEVTLREDCVNTMGALYTVDEENKIIEICYQGDCRAVVFADGKLTIIFDDDADFTTTLVLVPSDMALNDIKRPKRDRRLLSELKNGVTIREYTYNAEGKIKTRTVYTDEGVENFTSEYIYEADKLVELRTFAETGNTSRSEIVQIDSETMRVNGIDESGNVTTYNEYMYGDQTCGADKITYYGADNEVNVVFEYSYTGEKCNHTRTFRTGEGNEINSTIVETDDKRNRRTSAIPDAFRQGESKNFTNVVRTDSAGETIDAQSYSSYFEYNSDDYPTEETRSYWNGLVDQYVYIYQ